MRKMTTGKMISLGVVAIATIVHGGTVEADSAAWACAEARLKAMTLEEKVSLCAGSGTMTMPAIARVGITNEWQFSDNSQTVRKDLDRWTFGSAGKTDDQATVLPTLSALAATWNRDLATLFGRTLGEEARARGKDMMLGPGVNIMRTPLCGRNWEYFSEDPCLTAKLVVPEIRALQSCDVAACVKHFCVNNQEVDRHNNDAIVDDRTLNEIYLPAFEAAVREGGAYALMTGYNLYNGIRCSEHPYLIKGILRERWGFDGWIVSDWGGQHSTVPAALSGAGTEANGGDYIRYFVNLRKGTQPLAEAVKEGKVPESVVDEKAMRVLYTMERTKFFDAANREKGSRLTAAHAKAAQTIAEEAVVLLKNEQAVLPLDAKACKRIAVVGRLAELKVTTRGKSAEGKPPYEITFYDGLKEYLADKAVEIVKLPLVAADASDQVHAINESVLNTFDTDVVDAGIEVRAWKTEYFNNTKRTDGKPFATGFSKQPGFTLGTKAPKEGMNAENFAVRWTAKVVASETGEHTFAVKMDRRAGTVIAVDGKVLVKCDESENATTQARLEAGKEYEISVTYMGGSEEHWMTFGWCQPSECGSLEDIRREAEKCDAVLVFTGTDVGHGRANEGEGDDRPNMLLPEGYDAAIAEMLSWRTGKIVIINRSGAPVEMPWVEACPTLVHTSYLGQEAGRALSRVLFGEVDATGRLPCTFPKRYADCAVAQVGEITPRHSIYNERFYVGYRWFDHKKIAPMFPFGFGLSYTTFALGEPTVEKAEDGWRVRVKVTNTGTRTGKTVVQLYVAAKDSKVERCEKDLRDFAKTKALAPGESETLELTVTSRDLAYWDVASSGWKVEKCAYEFQLGFSAGEIVRKATVGVEEAVSPDGKNKIVLVKSQRPTIQVFRNGKPMMKPSPVAMKFDRADVRAVIELYADNDGVAYRWKTSAEGSVKVLDENAGINALSPDQRVHLQQANNLFKGDPFQNSWEHPAFGMKLREASTATNTLYFAPILFTGEQGVMAVTESDLRDYPGLNYRRARSCQRLDSVFAKWPVKFINTDWNEESKERALRHKRVVERTDYLVETAATRTYPWRVFLLADREIDLVRSAELVQRLAAPNAIGDVSWIRPGKVAWDWWNDWNLTNVDFKAGCNTRTYEYYIDFAAANGVEYVILDEGWSAKLNIWKFNPEVDVPHLIKYAEKRGVGIILWIAWAQAYDEPERVAEHFAKMGAKGFKADFMDRDDAEMVRFLERFADICAKRHLLLDYHGMYKPTGLEKTYPNILNFEGVFGLETMKFSKKFDMMQNDVNVVYSRLLAGPVDYTPGAMRNFARGTYTMNNHEPGSCGTRCRQMALMVLYTAPLMMLCDSPSQYLQNMECFRFMAAGPVVWDEVRPIDGRVDEYAVLARRKGDTWYVAGITDWSPREITVDLSFLPAGTKLEVFRDAPDCDTCATHYVHEHITLPPDGKLPLFLAPGGGFVLKTE